MEPGMPPVKYRTDPRAKVEPRQKAMTAEASGVLGMLPLVWTVASGTVSRLPFANASPRCLMRFSMLSSGTDMVGREKVRWVCRE